VDPVIASFTELLKNSGLSQAAMDVLSQMRLTTCNTTAINIVNAARNMHYQQTLNMIKVFSSSDEYMMCAQLDNFHTFRFAAEPRQDNPTTETIHSLTNMLAFFEKPPEFKEISQYANRTPIMPKLLDMKLIRSVQSYVCSNCNSELVQAMSKLFKECRLECTVKSSLRHFSSVGNLPLQSSRLTTMIQGIMGLLIEGLFGQKDREIALPLDPEFDGQIFRLNVTMYDRVKFFYMAPPIFHLMNHSIATSQKNMVFLKLVLVPFVQCLGMLKGKFLDFGKKMNNYINQKCAKQNITIRSHLVVILNMVRSASSGCPPIATEKNDECSNDDPRNGENNTGAQSDDDDEDENSECYHGNNMLFDVESEQEEKIGDNDEEPNTSKGYYTDVAINSDTLDTVVLCILRDILRIVDKKKKKKKNQNSGYENNEEIPSFEDDNNDSAFLKQISMTPKRIMYIYRLLHYSYQHLKEHNPDFFDNCNPLVKMVKTYFDSIVFLCVQPFDNCIASGNAITMIELNILIFCFYMIGNPELLWNSLRHYVSMFSLGCKPKIANVVIMLLAQHMHCAVHRQDFLRAMSLITPYLNEVSVYFFYFGIYDRLTAI
jgi:hypothetical protein